MEKGKLPPAVHFERLNEHIELEGSSFYVPTRLCQWEVEGGQRRRAAVSAFGFSGTNAHVVVEEYRPRERERIEVRGGEQRAVVLLSAKTAERLRVYAERMAGYVEGEEGLDLEALGYALQVGREAMEHRWALVARSREEVVAGLRLLADEGKRGREVFWEKGRERRGRRNRSAQTKTAGRWWRAGWRRGSWTSWPVCG